ncbi:MAG: glycosyltransferase family 4 protein [Pseudomonadota bacterium]
MHARLRQWAKDAYIGARTASRGLRSRRVGPVTISGFFSDPRGVAQAARLSAEMLEAAGIKVVRHDIGALLAGAMPPPPPGDGGVLLLHANPPEAAPLLRAWPPHTWATRYRIGYWVWELPLPPPSWRTPLPWLDEIWTPSRFSGGSLAKLGAPQKIKVIPHPVYPSAAKPDRARFGVRGDEVVVLTAFDFRSTRARKNPDGAIAAYRTAFPQPDGRTRLLIKALAPEADPQGARALAEIAASRPDITVIDRTLDQGEMDVLFASIDIFLSLHRSEGFGLMPAQAMALGKAVVTTGWSGVMEFADAQSAALVPFRLTPVKDVSGLYNLEGAEWAEPDVAAAAEMIRALAKDAILRAALGERAVKAIALKLNKTANPLSARAMAWVSGA